jgi:nicotinate-nucleotide adenylyltransferase
MNVAFFGGSFDPPHMGHVLAVSYALSSEALDKVLVVPVYEHAFSKSLSPFEHRIALTKLAMAPFTQVEVSAIERELPGPNYTLLTLRELQRRHPDWKLRLLVGSDVFAARDKWQGFPEIETIAPPLVLQRATSSATRERQLLPEVSSSEVRELLAERSNERSRGLLRQLIPASVLAYIEAEGLYPRG